MSETACRLQKTRSIFTSWDTVHSKGLPKGANRTRDLSVARVERSRCRDASSSNDRWATSLEELVVYGVLEVLYLLGDKPCGHASPVLTWKVLVLSCCPYKTWSGRRQEPGEAGTARNWLWFLVTPLRSELGNRQVNSARTYKTLPNSQSIQTSVCFSTAAADGLSPRLPSRVDVTCDTHRAKMQHGLDAGPCSIAFRLASVDRSWSRKWPIWSRVPDCG